MAFICFSSISIGFSQTQWTARESGTTANLTSIVWTDEKLVAVGDSGVILVSENGEVWETCSSGTEKDLVSIAWTSEKLVAVGNSGTLITSEDGIIWEKENSGDSLDIIFVSWADSMLVIIDYGNTIMVSEDGQTWRERSVDNYEFEFVIWSDTMFVGIGLGSIIATSPDLITWTVKKSGSVHDRLNSLFWNKKQFVTVGSEGMGWGVIYSSFDGNTWNIKYHIIPGPSFNSVCSSKANWVVVGNTGTILTSPDAETWTPQTSGTTRNLRCVTFTGTQYVAVGDSGTIITSPAENNTVTRKPVPNKNAEDIALKHSRKTITVHLPYSLQGTTVSVFSLAGKRIPMLLRKAALASFEIDIRDLAPGV
ncbi:MAG: hypothetical protein JW915_23090, partial [Chitinispirillaceae bacterium]|nr:hypothetical protein [Chitinispirillaceae bacterium]